MPNGLAAPVSTTVYNSDRISCPPPDYLGMTWLFGEPGRGVPDRRRQGHLFGTDANGRDLFIRVMLGGRVSLVDRLRRDVGGA